MAEDAAGTKKSSRYEERIADRSVWLSATPTPPMLGLPFYITEAGHFYAMADYAVNREEHDSFLLLYTLAGRGFVRSAAAEILLEAGSAVIIDCHKSHSYRAEAGEWEFLWLHVQGMSVAACFDILYPEEPAPVRVRNPETFSGCVHRLIDMTSRNDLVSAVERSAKFHEVFNHLVESSRMPEQKRGDAKYSEYVERAVEIMHEKYAEQVGVDDIIADIPLSKYYFIRMFKRRMGTTPYRYLTNYRINNAKILLRTTDLPVVEIAERCGFADTSNFITHFKQSSNQTPLQYRKYFLG